MPWRLVEIMLPLLKKADQSSIGFTDRATSFVCGNVFLTGRNIENDYPKYRDVIKKAGGPLCMSLDPGVWIQGLESMLPGLDEEKGYPVKLTMKNGKIELRGASSRTVLPAQVSWDSEEQSISFNALYLIDALSGFEDNVNVSCSPENAAMFQSATVDGCSLVMPVRG